MAKRQTMLDKFRAAQAQLNDRFGMVLVARNGQLAICTDTYLNWGDLQRAPVLSLEQSRHYFDENGSPRT